MLVSVVNDGQESVSSGQDCRDCRAITCRVGDRGEIRYLEVLKYQLFGIEFECDTTVARVNLFCSIFYFPNLVIYLFDLFTYLSCGFRYGMLNQ